MREFVHIPQALWPSEKEHVEHDLVFRATKNTDKLTVDDFLPWNIENQNQRILFGRQFKKPEYGMSVFTNIDSLILKLQRIPALRDKIKTISRGRTSIKRGISAAENNDHHVEYYLYDYLNNSPKDDFDICIQADELERMVNEDE